MNKHCLQALVVSLMALNSACTTEDDSRVSLVTAIETPAAMPPVESTTIADFCRCVTANNVIDFKCTRKLFDETPAFSGIESGFCVEIYCPQPNDDVWHANLCTIN